MNETHDSDELSATDFEPEVSADNDSSLVLWSTSSGDSSVSHLVHVDATGIAWLVNIKKPKILENLLGQISVRPAETAAIISAESKGKFLSRENLSRVTYAEALNQLAIFDEEGKKHKIPDGKEGEQRRIFEGVQNFLGGTASEEEADAWSVMQGPLFALGVTAAIGAFLIFVATDADPNKEFSGRRRGMKQLFNWLGYTIGPTWMSVIVGAVALGIFSYMMFLLVKRPLREVLAFKLV